MEKGWGQIIINKSRMGPVRLSDTEGTVGENKNKKMCKSQAGKTRLLGALAF